MSVKWLRRLKVVDRPYLTRMDGPGQPMLLAGGKAWRLTDVMEAKSVITRPSGGQRLSGWTPHSGSIWKTRVGTGVRFDTLYENGRRAVKARGPRFARG